MQPPKQLPPLLLDCLRYFLHIGQQLQESRRQQQRQAAVILEQQHAAAAASVSSSADQDTRREKPVDEKPPEPRSADAAEQSAGVEKEPGETADGAVETSTTSRGDDESTATSKPPLSGDVLLECTSSTAEDRGGKTQAEEGKGKDEALIICVSLMPWLYVKENYVNIISVLVDR